jgi:hypothetical protein
MMKGIEEYKNTARKIRWFLSGLIENNRMRWNDMRIFEQ